MHAVSADSHDANALAAAFAATAEQWVNYPMLRKGEVLWKELTQQASQLIEGGERDRLVTLADDPRISVRFCAAMAINKFAQDVTRRVLIDISEGKGNFGKNENWLRGHAADMLRIMFDDYRQRAWNAMDPELRAFIEQFVESQKPNSTTPPPQRPVTPRSPRRP